MLRDAQHVTRVVILIMGVNLVRELDNIFRELDSVQALYCFALL